MQLTSLLALAMLSPVQGPGGQQGGHERRPFPPIEEPRSLDGTGNHATDTDRGAAFIPLLRDTSVAYADGVDSPAGKDMPSARFVSNGVLAQDGDRPNTRGVSDMFWQWGQFLDHDITETPLGEPAESFPIAVPSGDIWFDPRSSGTVQIPLSRSFPLVVDGVREQVNAITAWVDGSQVYGSDDERALALRTLDGTGKLKTSDGDLLPFNTDGLHNAPSDALTNFFVAGDIRANEQAGLTAMHTLFVREHNYWARRIQREDEEWMERRRRGDGQGSGGQGGGRRLTRDGFDSGRAKALTGDEIYELARAIVSAELQIITYREWLPLLLGDGALGVDAGYDPQQDGSIRNEFATAAFRLGHSMLSGEILRLDRRGRPIADGPLSLADAFFNPDTVIATGIDPLLRGLVSQRAQELDMMIVDDVRNFLFGPPGAGGLDLGALNLQRGRDHGLPSYGQARRDLGLGAPASMDEISSDPDVVARLNSVARGVDALDLWVGGLAEDRVPGALVGPTFHTILTRQFRALRDGDRLWYSRQLSDDLIELVEEQSLGRILRRNSRLEGSFVEHPFLVR